MPQYQFKQVDVFTTRPFFGNPVAVVLDADDIAPADMQQIASWTNLSETTFVLRPTVNGADYRLRIFGPRAEIRFAGHPTIGSAHALLESGLEPRGSGNLAQECLAGLLPISMTGRGSQRRISVRVPEPKVLAEWSQIEEALSSALGGMVSRRAPPLSVDVGPVWLVAHLDDVETLRTLEPDMARIAAMSRDLGVAGVTVFAFSADSESAVHVRSFAPAVGVPEDPVCGSGNAGVGVFLAHSGMLQETGASYVARQGTELGRDGRVSVRVEDEGRRILIGGPSVTVIDGTIDM